MPIYKIDQPPIYGGPGKLLFDDIELSEEHAKILLEQKVISLKGKTGVVDSLVDSTTEVPQSTEVSTEDSSSVEAISSADSELLDFFNNATVGDLEGLRNIGKAKAEKIKSKAPYASLADVQAVAGMSNQAWNDAIADLTV